MNGVVQHYRYFFNKHRPRFGKATDLRKHEKSERCNYYYRKQKRDDDGKNPVYFSFYKKCNYRMEYNGNDSPENKWQ